jgi:hypothetical protein
VSITKVLTFTSAVSASALRFISKITHCNNAHTAHCSCCVAPSSQMSDLPNENLLQLTLQKLLSELISLIGTYIPPDTHQIILQYQQYLLAALPLTQQMIYELIDAIFSPKLLLKQLLVAMGLQVGVFTLQKIFGILFLLLSYCTEQGRKIISLNARMKEAVTYEEWKLLGERYDILQGDFVDHFHLFVLISLSLPPLSLPPSPLSRK